MVTRGLGCDGYHLAGGYWDPQGMNPADPPYGYSRENENAKSRSRLYIYTAQVSLFSNSRVGFAHAAENVARYTRFELN